MQKNDDDKLIIQKKELNALIARIRALERENQELRERLHCPSERKIAESKKNVHNQTVTLESSGINKSQGICGEDEVRTVIARPPPVPPPLPAANFVGGRNALRRVPELIELHRLLTRRSGHGDCRVSAVKGQTVASASSKDMIGEIENRSAYLSAIKDDVKKHKELIESLIEAVEKTAFNCVSDVEKFVKWLDDGLINLIDERAVLKHFPMWPERKEDALREAAFCYRALRNLDIEIASFKQNFTDHPNQNLQKMNALQDRVEDSVDKLARSRESAIERYRLFNIPWRWMLETGVIGQIRLNSVKIAKEYMRSIINELRSDQSLHRDHLLHQGVRFAFRVHQFAGGFDAEALEAFNELRETCKDTI